MHILTTDDPHSYPASNPVRQAASKLVIGVALVVLVVVLGIVAKLSGVTNWGLHVDQSIAADVRTPALTAVAASLTYSATPETTGIAAVIVVPVLLVLLRRRLDALKAFSVLVGALGLTVIVKAVIAEPRPPASLWAIPADSGASYPSGHTTVAAAIIAALVVVARTRRWRTVVVVVGGVYALAAAASRVYLANHYPPDVVGSLLIALAAGFIVTGLAATGPRVRPGQNRRRPCRPTRI